MLLDRHHRQFVYLRLSVTDRCNFKCSYCLPQGYEASSTSQEPELTPEEIRRLVTAFATLGVVKVRLTGGEPTVRRDILEIAETLALVPGIQKVALTTNGYRLAALARSFKLAGVRSINVSVDSLDPHRFASITGTDRLNEVLKGIDQALAEGFESVKVNAVLLKDEHPGPLQDFIRFVKDRPVSVRFIELMKTGKNQDRFARQHLSAGTVQWELQKSGWELLEKNSTDGPALVYRHPDSKGTIGLIAPYSEGFCSSCNRLRVSSRGALKLCLFSSGEDVSLRSYLQSDSDLEPLVAFIRNAVLEKPEAHHLKEGNYGKTWNFSTIGG